ncbi:hypothetical protein ACS0TY_020701 [Phlomoides rotata]
MGGCEERSKTPWIKWEVVCNEKSNGGLGIRDLGHFNSALLSKWIWKFKTEPERLWVRVIKSRNGGVELVSGRFESREAGREGGRGCINSNISGWWKEICKLYVGKEGRGVRQDMYRLVGEGRETSFWKDCWAGTESLSKTFNRLFRISCQQEESIGEMGCWGELGWEWNLRWKRGMRSGEQLHLSRIHLRRGEGDVWRWRHTKDGLFSTASAYQNFWKRTTTESEEQEQKSAFYKLWKSYAPRRYQAIVWKELHSRLPTKEKLQRMGIISSSNDIKCSMCGEEKETATHLLISCRVVQSIWAKIYEWMDVVMVPHADLGINLLQHSELLGQGKRVRIAATIWICIRWVIWNCRNKANFSEETPNIDMMIGEIKARSWNWVGSKLKEMEKSDFTDWSRDIRRCLDRLQDRRIDSAISGL